MLQCLGCVDMASQAFQTVGDCYNVIGTIRIISISKVYLRRSLMFGDFCDKCEH